MKYIRLVMVVPDRYQEALIAELLELEFDAFEQQEGKLITYVSKERFNDVNRERIERVLAAFHGDGFIQSEEVVADRNWNEEWEQTIKAQQIGQFYVKPTWDTGVAPTGTLLLEIDPKMAFGTGYHETTRLMLNLLPEVIKENDQVLDAGTGTGILGIASAKLGAGSVFAFDIDEWSIRNAAENILINEVNSRVRIEKGSSEVIPEVAEYDVILANINRNAIIELLPELVTHLKTDGALVVSGLLVSDEEIVLNQEALHDFQFIRSRRENEWIALHFKKRN